MKLYVKNQLGDQFTLDASQDNTVQDILKKLYQNNLFIRKDLSFAQYEQAVSLYLNETKLDSMKSLAHYGLGSAGCQLYLTPAQGKYILGSDDLTGVSLPKEVAKAQLTLLILIFQSLLMSSIGSQAIINALSSLCFLTLPKIATESSSAALATLLTNDSSRTRSRTQAEIKEELVEPNTPSISHELSEPKPRVYGSLELLDLEEEEAAELRRATANRVQDERSLHSPTSRNAFFSTEGPSSLPKKSNSEEEDTYTP